MVIISTHYLLWPSTLSKTIIYQEYGDKQKENNLFRRIFQNIKVNSTLSYFINTSLRTKPKHLRETYEFNYELVQEHLIEETNFNFILHLHFLFVKYVNEFPPTLT